MTFTLHVDGPAWREHTSSVRDALRSAIRGDTGMSRLGDLVPVAKGNGYGQGLRRLAAEATRLGVDRLAVGTVFEIAEVAEAFHGEILVMSPWDPRDTVAAARWRNIDSSAVAARVIRTISDAETAKRAPLELPPGSRIVIEGITSMRRFGMLENELLSVVGAQAMQSALAQGRLHIEGLALHLPLAMPEVHHVSATKLPRGTSTRVIEVQGWAKTWRAALEELLRAEVPVSENANSLWVSHLTDDELTSLRGLEPDVAVNARVGTRLWLGDGQTLSARGTILAVHPVGRRFAVGYRQRKASSDGLLLVVGGGTSHGVAMAAPTPAASCASVPSPPVPGLWKPPGAVAPRSNGATNCCGSPNLRICRSRCCGCLTRYCARVWPTGCGIPRSGTRWTAAYATPRLCSTPCSTTHDLDPAQPRRPRRRQRQRGGRGPAGTRVLLGATWWNVFRVLILMTATAAAVGYLSKYYCLINGWGEGKYTHLCYSDIPPLYSLRGLADGAIPTSATSLPTRCSSTRR